MPTYAPGEAGPGYYAIGRIGNVLLCIFHTKILTFSFLSHKPSNPSIGVKAEYVFCTATLHFFPLPAPFLVGPSSILRRNLRLKPILDTTTYHFVALFFLSTVSRKCGIRPARQTASPTPRQRSNPAACLACRCGMPVPRLTSPPCGAEEWKRMKVPGALAAAIGEPGQLYIAKVGILA